MTNSQLAAVFTLIGDILDFQGANPFRVRAYRNAARTIGDYPEPLAPMAADGPAKLRQIGGIGEDLAAKIQMLVSTGSLPMLEELKSQVPESVLALVRIPGVGPKKAAALAKELGIQSLADLKAACEAGRVRVVKGFGEKTEQLILQGMSVAEQANVRIYWSRADDIATALRAHLAAARSIEQLEFAGSYRRGKDTVGDLDILVVSSNPAEVMDRFAALPAIEQVLARGDTKMSIRIVNGLQIDLRVVPRESFGAAARLKKRCMPHWASPSSRLSSAKGVANFSGPTRRECPT
jgi:DNA polymerase (family X)